MSNSYPNNACYPSQTHSHPPHPQYPPTGLPPQPAANSYPPPGYPAGPQAYPTEAQAYPIQPYPLDTSQAGPSAYVQQPPAGYPGQASSSGAEWAQEQQQQPGQQYAEQQTQDSVGPDGSRGLGTSLLGAGHKVHKVGLALHHLAHPVQGLKYHTVDKVKRKVKGKLCHMVDKVVP